MPGTLAFRRGDDFVCATAFGDAAWAGPAGATPILTSDPAAPAGPSTTWYRLPVL